MERILTFIKTQKMLGGEILIAENEMRYLLF